MPELVNHPAHYNDNPFGLETIEIIRHYGFNIGSALKHILRAGKKGIGEWAGKELDEVDSAAAEVQDLQKAVWYLNDRIETIRSRYPGYDLGMPETAQDEESEQADDEGWQVEPGRVFEVNPSTTFALSPSFRLVPAQQGDVIDTFVDGVPMRFDQPDADLVAGEAEAIAAFVAQNPGLAAMLRVAASQGEKKLTHAG